LNLQSLNVLAFKNIDESKLSFSTRINCFVGENGVGKTNYLDAIYHLAMGKSYFNAVALQNIQNGRDFFLIEGTFEGLHQPEHVVCSLKKGHKKVMKRNGKAYEKLAEHVGRIPLVMISPADTDLIHEGSETRRKFMDSVISQWDQNYLSQLMDYQKVLSQRNALLKHFASMQTFDEQRLAPYDYQLCRLAPPIFESRKKFVEAFIPLFKTYYNQLSNAHEVVDVIYESALLDADMQQLLKEMQQKDRVLQYTTAGIHKDDLKFRMHENPVKKFGSQGQQKTYLIALKLAQFDLLFSRKGQKPILLLDDIFDKLDDQRVANLVAMVQEDRFGQIFITDTHYERTESVVKKTHQPYQMIRVDRPQK
jgi:DNA replication and repair protein RecF